MGRNRLRAARVAEITQRRQKVAANLLAGMTYRELALALNISVGTAHRDAKAILARWSKDAIGDIEKLVLIESRRLDIALNQVMAKVGKGNLSAVDRLLAIIVPLVGEVAVLRDRLDAVERLAEQHGVFAQAEVEEFVPSVDQQTARDAWREQYLERIFRITQAEREEATAGRGVDLDKVIDDFTAGRI